ncbi:uncharacterized mitochondrial protein AtMg00810-like [Impatiens glandulifera]|uniref:uncharacterized mitochondrial protein AtMg00810-like n=1 Tax=Impatiens glandulifera TaxID=253017 RepID=UPI001FB184A7|nr:uncharacterized mitochondrial protein AtMg00810-like [Impatiens glandulifera]
MKDLRHLSYFLGLEIASDKSGYYLSQAKYATDLISRASITETKVVNTPFDSTEHLTNTNGDPTDRRSTTGYSFFLGTSLISRRSKKQTVVSRSSTEFEYRALADTTSNLLWLQWVLQDMDVPSSAAIPLFYDNNSVMQIAHNDVFHERTKHIERDCHLT